MDQSLSPEEQSLATEITEYFNGLDRRFGGINGRVGTLRMISATLRFSRPEPQESLTFESLVVGPQTARFLGQAHATDAGGEGPAVAPETHGRDPDPDLKTTTRRNAYWLSTAKRIAIVLATTPGGSINTSGRDAAVAADALLAEATKRNRI